MISLEITKPTEWNQNEFVMILRWESVEDLKIFVATSWNQAHIPNGIEKYIGECGVSHYYNIELINQTFSIYGKGFRTIN